MRIISYGILFAFAAHAWADTIILRQGGQIQGTYLGGTTREVRVDVGDRIQTVGVGDIQRIEFDAPAPPPPPPPQQAPPPQPPPPQAAQQFGPGPGDGQRSGIELPAGTNLVVRMIEGVDSQNSRPGQSFAASLDEPVYINGQQVIPRGADVRVKLTDAKDSGKLTGRTELTLALVSVQVNGRPVDVNSQTVSRESSSRGARTAKVAGGTAAVGAIIGALAGGGKGAAIGAGAGAAAGAGSQVFTKGQRVKIPSETRLTFTLDTMVRL
jgi:hypothetical protein